jgi:hypothetical protein
MSVKTRKKIEYIGEILPDGHLSIPDEIKKELELHKSDNLKITLTLLSSDEKRGWEIFRQMGRNAESGTLPNAWVDHDKYLYGKPK